MIETNRGVGDAAEPVLAVSSNMKVVRLPRAPIKPENNYAVNVHGAPFETTREMDDALFVLSVCD